MSRNLVFGLTAILLIFWQQLVSASASQTIESAVETLLLGGTGVELSRARRSGLVSFVRTSPDTPLQNFAVFVSAEDRARSFLAANQSAFIDLDTPLELIVVKISGPDVVGQTSIRFAQQINGIPVVGGELILHLNDAGVTAVNSRLVPNLANVPLQATISADSALTVAKQRVLKQLGPATAAFSSAQLVVIDAAVFGGLNNTAVLAWYVEATGPSVWEKIWINATTGELVASINQITEARNRITYDARNTSTIPNVAARNETGPATGNVDVDQAHDFAGDFYDYFFNTHGRDSWDNTGANIVSVVRLCDAAFGCPMQNAFWNGVRVAFGEGFAIDDIVAHELTHGVIQSTANLVYQDESGALNESFSDIFGETIDLVNLAGTDTNATRWVVGEDLAGRTGIRDMMNPGRYGDPARVKDAAYFCGTQDNGGVHTNSGVPNHAYALMVDGGSFNGYAITGIGLTKAGLIQYRALNRYLTSTSNFLSTYNALIQSCSDLLGTNGIVAQDCAQVKNSLLAVEMSTPSCSAVTPPPPPDTAPQPLPDVGGSFCPGNAAPILIFEDDMENTSSGNWSNTLITGVNHWNGGAGSPPIYFAENASSGLYSLKGTGRTGIGDSVVAMTSNVSLPSNAYLQFAQDFNFESGYDGGVLEYSTNNGGSWTDAGSLVSAGRNYTGAIVPGSDNPLAGRLAFTGNSSGYLATRLDLSSFAGQNIRFRFRASTDGFVASPGWYVDSVLIYQCISNIPPVANAQNFTVDEDVSISITLSGSDADGDPLSFRVTNLPANGILSGTAPNLSYRSQPNFNGQDSFQFVANDGVVDSAVQTITVQVRGINDPPIANNRIINATEDSAASVLLTGTDVDGDNLAFRIVSTPANGSLAGNPPNVSYTPALNFNGADSFTYVANDGLRDSPVATVSLNVAAVNDTPLAQSRTVGAAAGVPVNIQLSGSDVDGDNLSYRIITSPLNGSLTGTPPALVYTPPASFSGSDSFIFVANDGSVDSAQATISINVAVGNQPPLANASNLSVLEDQPLSITLSGQDPDGDALTYSVIGAGPQNGVLTGTAPNFSYQPFSDFNGSDSFEFIVSDGQFDSNPALINISITAVNDAPVAAPVTVAGTQNQSVNVTLAGSDVDGDALSYTVLSQPINGSLSGTAPALVYTPGSGFSGTDSFTYRVSDGALSSQGAGVTISIGTGSVPVANAQTLNVNEDVDAAIVLTGSDADGDALVYTIESQVSHGTITGQAPNLNYQPDLNFNGRDSFTFRVSDGVLSSTSATVAINVQAVNDVPVAQSISQGTNINTAVTIRMLADDIDGDTLAFRVIASPVSGTLTGNPPTVIYTPPSDFSGTDSFTYVANDGSVDSNVATVSITVAPTNPPVASNGAANTNEDSPVEILLNGSDPDGDSITFAILSDPVNGVLNGTPPLMVYVPNANFSGVDSFSFSVSDGVLSSAPATVSINVVAVNDPPVASNLNLTTPQDRILSIPFSATDEEGDTVSFRIVSSPMVGVLTGSVPNINYVAAADYIGTDSFTYVANDGNRNSQPATVRISVTTAVGDQGNIPREVPTGIPGITVTPTEGLITTEAGGIASFEIVLDSQPAADVKLSMISSDLTEGRLLKVSYSFTPNNWDEPQTVEVMGMTDRFEDGRKEYFIVIHAAESDDPAYNGIKPDNVALANIEADGSIINITPISGLTTTEYGKTATFIVSLSSQPAAGVIIRFASSDDSEGKIVPPALGFTQNTWRDEKIVTITGLDDDESDGDVQFDILTKPIESKDPLFNNVDPPNVRVTNSDNDDNGDDGGGGALSQWFLGIFMLLALARRRRY